MAEALEPKVAALLVANDAFRDERGRVHVHGVFDTIMATQFPANIGFTIFVSFKGSRQGTYQAMVQILDSLNAPLVKTEAMTFEVSELKGHNLFLNINARFPAPQLYKIKLFVDGIERLEIPLMVRQAAAPPPGPQEKKG